MTTREGSEVPFAADHTESFTAKRRAILTHTAILACGALLGAIVSYRWRSCVSAPTGAIAPRPPHTTGRVYEAAQLERVGMHFSPVALVASDVTIDVVGVLELNRQRVAEVSTYAAGRATTVRAVVGQRVRGGELLALIESPAIGEAAAQFQVKQAELRSARQHHMRLSDLAAQQLTTHRELELSEAHERSAEAELRAARARLRALGITPGGLDARTGHAPLVAPMEGVVIRRNVLLGGWVQPEAEAFAIADLSNLWAELDVYEGDLGFITAGDPVRLDVGALGLHDQQGKVELIYTELDRATRMGKVRVVVPNPRGQLHAGLSVAAHIRPGGHARRLVLPVESVRQRGGRPHVLVRHGTQASWESIETGAQRGGTVEIMNGLREGDLVAISGVGLIGNEP